MEQQKQSMEWRERAAKIFCFAMLLLGIYLVLRYAKTLLIVIAIVWGVSAVIDGLARRTARVTHLPRKLLAVLYLILLIVLLGAILFLALHRLWRELEELVLWMEENRDVIGEKVSAVMASTEELIARIPILGDAKTSDALSEFGVRLDTMISEFIHQAFLRLGSSLTISFGGLVRGTPKALVTVIVTVLACFYLSMDYEGLRDRLISLFPTHTAHRLDGIRQKAGVAVRRFLRAYLLLMLLTFSEVFVGLMILGKSYAFLLALLVAFVDILPVLGAGTVLVPWAVVSILLKNYYFGFGLLVLFGVVTIVRQIAEPHLVGGSLGIHPLVSLLFLFAGLELFGFFGMILGPATALILKEILLPDKSDCS
ncbi:MAG: sporulation integral membrane protein YtvI [Clostridia bacterium]|nr:sporulation integral membrane protein YtvI [Clostridia bacterium]